MHNKVAQAWMADPDGMAWASPRKTEPRDESSQATEQRRPSGGAVATPPPAGSPPPDGPRDRAEARSPRLAETPGPIPSVASTGVFSEPAEARQPGPPVSGAPGVSGVAETSRPPWEDGSGVFSNAVRAQRSRPRQGWRAAVYSLSGGRWNPGLSEAEERLRAQLTKIRTPLPGPHSVVVSSIKGGVGKTTVTGLLGLALAEHRGDRVIAVDANPDAGTLGDRLVGEQEASKTTVRDLLKNIHEIMSATQLSGYTHLAGRLHVLASEQEPELSEMFSAADYETVLRLLSRYFQVVLTDSGTGVVHSAMQGSLRHADSLVIVGAPTKDAASRASRTLHWMATHQDEHGRFPYEQLARDAVVVLSHDRSSPHIDDTVIREHFQSTCRAVVELPADPHLSTGGIVDLDALAPATRDAALSLAATVAEGFQGRRTTGLAAHGFRADMRQ